MVNKGLLSPKKVTKKINERGNVPAFILLHFAKSKIVFNENGIHSHFAGYTFVILI